MERWFERLKDRLYATTTDNNSFFVRQGRLYASGYDAHGVNSWDEMAFSSTHYTKVFSHSKTCDRPLRCCPALTSLHKNHPGRRTAMTTAPDFSHRDLAFRVLVSA